jgi:hypothetical protein
MKKKSLCLFSLISIVLLALHLCRCIKAKHAFAEPVTPRRSSATSVLHRVQTRETGNLRSDLKWKFGVAT